MAGDPTKASLWADADVYIAPKGTALPANANAAWPSGWEAAGLLNGDDGFAHNRSQDQSDKFAWGQVLVRSPRKNFKATVSFSALEDNDVTRELVWPGSTSSKLVVPEPAPILVGLELREGARVKRLITAFHAEADAGAYNETESDLTKYPITLTIFPNSDKELWVVQDTGARSVASLAITGTAPGEVGEIGKLTATATFSPAGTADVSHVAAWSSSDPAKATVHPGGFVTGVAVGAATITASYGGKSDTESVTITT